MKKILLLCLLCASSFAVLIPSQIASSDIGTRKSYGVFIGLEPCDLSKLYNYSTVVIDASYFSSADIQLLHDKQIKVYSYINLGSIENFRTYYEEFEPITLGAYENWPEERWIDVSQIKWQEYFKDVIAKELVDKGIDGFFIDNLDVYSVYKKPTIYKGILTILKGLNETYQLPIIANGGYAFLTAAKNNKIDLKTLIHGVNQESVFSSVNFETNTFSKNNIESRKFVLLYLNSLKAKGINIYLLEYTKSASLIKEIEAYCKKNNFNYYIASSLELN